MHNTWYFLFLVVFFAGWVFNMILDLMNYRHSCVHMSAGSRELSYFKDNFWLSFISALLSGMVIFSMLLFGCFGMLDTRIAEQVQDPYLRAVTYFLSLLIIAGITSMPFSYYRTFKIEEQYGFNRTTIKTFFSDKVKSLLLSVFLGGTLVLIIMWFYALDPGKFWIYAWLSTSLVMIFISMLYTSILLPLFNKLSPLEKGSLNERIRSMCDELDFPLNKLFVMDGSKRSTKANAFFSGLGPRKTIVLYDTLIRDYSEDEILAVLAHEIGHYKRKHTVKTLAAALIQNAVMFYLLGCFLRMEEPSIALGAGEKTFHLSVIAFGILYSPFSTLTGFLMNSLSRKHEYEADRYAKENFNGSHLASALKKLHKDALSNPFPHPAYVAVHYSHPTLKDRVERLN